MAAVKYLMDGECKGDSNAVTMESKVRIGNSVTLDLIKKMAADLLPVN